MAHARPQYVFDLQRAVTAYEEAFKAALSVNPDREIILAYAQSATIYAQYSKNCDAATVGTLNPSVLDRTRAFFADWRTHEKAFVEAGYRAIDYKTLYDSTRWPAGASKKVQFFIFAAFFTRREEGEAATLYCEEMLRQHPALELASGVGG